MVYQIAQSNLILVVLRKTIPLHEFGEGFQLGQGEVLFTLIL